MIIFQKNFEEPIRNNYVELPQDNPSSTVVKTPWSEYAKPAPPAEKSQPSEEDYLQSALKKKKSISYFERNSLSPQEQSALNNNTEKVRSEYDESALNQIKKDLAATEAKNTPKVPTVTENVPVIDTTLEVEDAPKMSLLDTAKVKAKVATTNTKNAVGEGLNNAKEKISSGFDKAKDKISGVASKMSESYGEGLTGSLAGDAALAAGGLALAGGAYHLLKKRREKKKAEKEALDKRVLKK